MKSFIILIPLFILASCGGNSPGENIPGVSNRFRINNELKRLNELTTKELVRTASDFMEKDKTYVAKGSTPSNCGGTRYSYRLKSRNDSTIDINLRLHYTGDTNTESLNLLKNCYKISEQFFKKHNLNLKISRSWYSRSSFFNESKEADFDIKLSQKNGRSNKLHWYLKDPNICSVIIHEIGHLLGLPDEYTEEGTCRTEKYGSKERDLLSVMAFSTHYVQKVDFLPRHILQILEQGIQSELSIKSKKTIPFNSLLPLCRAQRDREILDLSDVQFMANTTYIFKETLNSSMVGNGSKHPAFAINEDASVFFKCPETGKRYGFFELEEKIDSEAAEVSLKPFSFNTHQKFSPLYLRYK